VIGAQCRASCETSRFHYELVINSFAFAVDRAQISPRANAENVLRRCARTRPANGGEHADRLESICAKNENEGTVLGEVIGDISEHAAMSLH
jgi:hypothetical protein